MERRVVGVELSGGGVLEPGEQPINESVYPVRWQPLDRGCGVQAWMTAPLDVRSTCPSRVACGHVRVRVREVGWDEDVEPLATVQSDSAVTGLDAGAVDRHLDEQRAAIGGLIDLKDLEPVR